MKNREEAYNALFTAYEIVRGVKRMDVQKISEGEREILGRVEKDLSDILDSLMFENTASITKPAKNRLKKIKSFI